MTCDISVTMRHWRHATLIILRHCLLRLSSIAPFSVLPSIGSNWNYAKCVVDKLAVDKMLVGKMVDDKMVDEKVIVGKLVDDKMALLAK